MSDRELLEAAAKAAGLTITPMMFELGKWNPLEDDGDALRLAVNLGISTAQDDSIEIDTFTFCGVTQGEYVLGVEAWKVQPGGEMVAAREVYDADRFAATRRAIVCAAAAIGAA